MKETTDNEKTALRRAYAKKTAALPPAYAREASAAITARVTAHAAFRAARSVFLYVSVPGEPDTATLIRAALAAGKRVFVPRCAEKPRMDAVEITAQTVFVPGPFGIPTPADGRAARPGEIDLAIIPCVAAAKDGARLGHGGGYYDAFLAARPCPALCLCFAALLADTLPRAPHDVPADAVVTENGIWEAEKKRRVEKE